MAYQERQLYAECQLVTVINAAKYYGITTPEIGDPEYEELVDLVGAKHGSAICIAKSHHLLGVVAVDIHPSSLKKLRNILSGGHPVGIDVWGKRTGFHSVLAADYKFGFYRLTNASKIVKNGWVSGLRLRQMIKQGSRPNIVPLRGGMRIYYPKLSLDSFS